MRPLVFLLFAAALQAQTAAPRDRDPEVLAEKSSRARQALLENRFAEAVSLYRELVRALPQNPGLRMNLAIALDKAGQPSAAIPEIERVTRANPSSAAAWFLLGIAYQQLKRPEDAIRPLREAIRLEPTNPDALLELGDAELTTGAAADAVREFAALTALKASLPKAWEGLGRAYLLISESAFQHLKNIASESPYLVALVARSRASEERYGEALSLMASVVERAPDLPGVHAARAEIYQKTNHEEWAAIETERESHVAKPDCERRLAACAYLSRNWRVVLRAAEKSQPPENLYWNVLAASHLAEESFGKLAELQRSPEMHAVLADSYQRLGRRLDAVAEWRKAVDLNPTDRLLQGRLAESLIRARIYPDAERILVPLVANQPEDGEWQYLLGNLLLLLKRDEEALPHLIAATERSPNSLPAHEALGRVYLDLGKPVEAVVQLEKTRALDDGSISFALNTAYRQLGRLEDARVALARYRAMTRQRAENNSTSEQIPISAP